MKWGGGRNPNKYLKIFCGEAYFFLRQIKTIERHYLLNLWQSFLCTLIPPFILKLSLKYKKSNYSNNSFKYLRLKVYLLEKIYKHSGKKINNISFAHTQNG